jgi:hypothetical protein
VPTKSKRPALKLTAQELEQLRERAQSLSAPHREVHRAKILVRYLANETFTEIAQALRTPRRIVYKCVDKALAMGVESALQDVPHGRPGRTIQPEDRAWVPVGAAWKPDALTATVASQFIDVLAQSCANGNGASRASGNGHSN